VVRHGATPLNNDTDLSEDRIRGWRDVPLAPAGKEEAKQAAEKLRHLGIQVIVTSSLVRAEETAQIISQQLGGIPVQANPNLRPWNLGNFTGATTKDALPQIAQYVTDRPDEPVPGGESFHQFMARANHGLQEAIQLANGRPLVVVTHHRNERLWKAEQATGWQPGQLDLDTFLQKGDPPGGVFEMQINPAVLSPMGGAQPPGAPVPGPSPGNGAGAPPMPPGGAPAAPQAGLPVPEPGQPPGMPGAPGAAPPQPNPMFAQLMAVQQKMAQIGKAIDLLRQDIPRGYRIDIEVDTMVAGDQLQERQDATQFIEAVTQFVMEAGKIAMVQPDFAPLAAKMLQFGVRKFRTGRELESAIDEYADKIMKAPPKPQQPNPEHQKAQADAEAAQTKATAEITKSKLDAQSAQANDQRQQQIMELEFKLKQQEFQFRMAEMEREEQFKMAEHNRKLAEANMQHQQRMQTAMMPRPVPNGGAMQ
jgi:broad specificity phosphatase PhoE